MTYLRLENISKRFGENQALRDINLEIDEETFCVLLGPSGCGKSTLLNIVAGLEMPSTGRIYLEDRDITGLPPHRRDIAMVFQDYALYPHLNVYENLAFGLRVRKMPRDIIERKIRDVSRILNIGDKLDRYPRQLSGGERQRVATGRAIVRDPNLFLFDEPLSNLDARLRLELRKEFLQLQHRLKKTSLYVTHDQIEALSLGDIVVVLNDGRVQQVSRPRELYDNPENLFVAGFIGTPPMNIIEMDVQYDAGKPRLARPGFAFAAPERLTDKLSRAHHEKVFLGIRPSAVRIVHSNETGLHVFDARVQIVEMLGEDALVHVLVAEEIDFRAIFNHREWDNERNDIRISFDSQDMYFFDSDGSRL
ncbi:MAG: ABC transporter ATP-binding protein [bacterium]